MEKECLALRQTIKCSLLDVAFLLTVGSFLLTAEFFAYNCVWELFCLQLELVYLHFELFCLHMSFFAYSGKSVSKKHLNGL